MDKFKPSIADAEYAKSLIANYPEAYLDFYGSGASCIYKTGPPWPQPEGYPSDAVPEPYEREIRPASHSHPLASAHDTWRALAKTMVEYFDFLNFRFNTITPIGVSNYRDEFAYMPPLCPLLVIIGVKPRSVGFEEAKSAADHVKEVILTEAGFGDVDVAVMDMRVWGAFSTDDDDEGHQEKGKRKKGKKGKRRKGRG